MALRSHLILWLCSLMVATFAMDGMDWVFRSNPSMPRANLMKDDGTLFDQMPNEFTICFYHKPRMVEKDDFTIVSYATEDEPNELYMDFDYKNTYTALSIHGKALIFHAVPKLGGWTHVCISWSNIDGVGTFYLDGEEVAEDNDVFEVQEGYQIAGGGYFVIGQDQDEYNGGYDATQGFSGRLTQVNIWSRVLSPNEVTQAMNCHLNPGGDVADWNSANWGLYENMMFKETTAPCYKSCDGTVKTNQCRNREPTYLSPYDLETGFDDQKPHDVDATLKGVTFNAMDAFTLCFQLYNMVTNFRMRPITYASPDGKKVIAFGFNNWPYGFYVKVGKEKVVLEDGLNDGAIVPLCITWSSQTGNVTIYYDGNISETIAGVKKGYIIPANGKLAVHQRQLAAVDTTNPKANFRYKVSDLYMWRRELTAAEVFSFTTCTGSVDDYIVNPEKSQWDVEDKGCPSFSKLSPMEDPDSGTYPKEVAGLLQFFPQSPPPAMTDMSICFWGFSNVDDPTVPTFFSTRAYTGVALDTGALQVKINGRPANFAQTSYFKANKWTHVCITRSAANGNTVLYVNGTKVDEVSNISPGYILPEGSPWAIKNFQNAPTSESDPTVGITWKGTEYNVWNQALNADQVSQLYYCPLTVQGTVINSRTALWKREY